MLDLERRNAEPEVEMRTRETVRTLNRLVRTCRDGELLARVCGDAVESADLRTFLRQRSDEWGRQGDELQALVLLLGGEPATVGTPAGRLLRASLALRLAIAGPSDVPALDVWQRAERRALERYGEALSGYLPERIRRTVSLQADRIGDRCDRLGIPREGHPIPSQGIWHV